MKVIFNKSDFVPFNELITYNSITRIPFTLKLSDYRSLPETIWCRNLSGENFIEFMFDKKTLKLYEITVVSIQDDTVKLVLDNMQVNDVFFECQIVENSEWEISKPIKILRSKKSLSFVWGDQTSMKYAVASNCILGVDDNGYLSSLSLMNLSEAIIYDILGF